jgi:hypothetical protein
MAHEWVLLIHQLPPNPTNLRVRTWRRLQRLGAIAIKNSVYVLPFNDKTYEDFQWLKQEIESVAGEATVLRASAVEGKTDDEIVSQFRNTRNDEYAQVIAELDGLTGAIREQKRGGHLSAGRINTHESELDKLDKELDRIISTDFFSSPGRVAAVAARERSHKALRTSQDRNTRKSESIGVIAGSKNLSQYQGRRWFTRKGLFIDRLAAIWFIRRFVDKKARFQFVNDGESIAGAIGFDIYGAEFTHRGEDCTFETMIKEFQNSENIGLQQLAEIVHDIDIKDGKYGRSEAAGLDKIIRGLSEWLKNDRKLIQQSLPIFDALYELLSQSENGTGKRKNVRKGDKKRARR